MGIFSFLSKGNTLFYPGCLSRYVLKAEAENYKKILTKIGVDYIMLPNELCCGSPTRNAGYEKDAVKLARKNFDLFKEHNIKKIITNCPACFKMFVKDYKEMLSDWDIEVEHTTTIILKYLRKKGIENPKVERVAYHDPCHLGRHSEIYNEPREILNRLGFEVVEMANSRENSLCCGGGAGLKANNPELANKIAKIRIEQARNLEVKKIITTCPLCFAHLQENSNTGNQRFPVPKIAETQAISGIEVLEFSHVITRAFNILLEKTDVKAMKEVSSR